MPIIVYFDILYHTGLPVCNYFIDIPPQTYFHSPLTDPFIMSCEIRISDMYLSRNLLLPKNSGTCVTNFVGLLYTAFSIIQYISTNYIRDKYPVLVIFVTFVSCVTSLYCVLQCSS
jgi:hypothetical protein